MAERVIRVAGYNRCDRRREPAKSLAETAIPGGGELQCRCTIWPAHFCQMPPTMFLRLFAVPFAISAVWLMVPTTGWSQENLADEKTEVETPSTEPAAAPALEPAAAPALEPAAEPASAEPTPEAVTAANEPDPAALMGEFVGSLGDEDQPSILAMQIRPLADGRFEAISYRGGLPGQPDCQPHQTTTYIGLRNGDSLVLSGGEQAIFVDPNGCTLISRDGQNIGRLDRVQRSSPTLGAVAPEGATVLFADGKPAELIDAKTNDEGLLQRGATIRPLAQDFDIHLEFRLPMMFNQVGQARGNSGVYLQGRYECQVLDSFALTPVFNGCGSLYRFKPPTINAALPPGVWQTYDIRFTAARFAAGGEKIRDAHVTSWLNGTKVQDDVALHGPTGNGAEESPTPLPTKLQDHRDDVVYRNVWMIDRGLSPGVEFPVMVVDQPQ